MDCPPGKSTIQAVQTAIIPPTPSPNTKRPYSNPSRVDNFAHIIVARERINADITNISRYPINRITKPKITLPTIAVKA
ncbi:protein of unknown function [Xenorhabdus doucetiae]|uniref:Uncharacterized protein n=1 Tax=Xenorhabdus doucetiae TaxID=351671 RepID=A0A068QWQ6_9GAMM|nr:protein of unknown function [Xenorhabdus doucetiae]